MGHYLKWYHKLILKKRGPAYLYWVLDMALDGFMNSAVEIIPWEMIRETGMPHGYQGIISDLAAEGYLQALPNGVRITFKGREILKEGGFFRRYCRKKVLKVLEVMGLIIGIAGGIYAIVAASH